PSPIGKWVTRTHGSSLAVRTASSSSARAEPDHHATSCWCVVVSARMIRTPSTSWYRTSSPIHCWRSCPALASQRVSWFPGTAATRSRSPLGMASSKAWNSASVPYSVTSPPWITRLGSKSSMASNTARIRARFSSFSGSAWVSARKANRTFPLPAGAAGRPVCAVGAGCAAVAPETAVAPRRPVAGSEASAVRREKWFTGSVLRRRRILLVRMRLVAQFGLELAQAPGEPAPHLGVRRIMGDVQHLTRIIAQVVQLPLGHEAARRGARVPQPVVVEVDELVTVGAQPVVRQDMGLAVVVLVVAVVDGVLRLLARAAQLGEHTQALHVPMGLGAGRIEDRAGEIHIGDQLLHRRARVDAARIADQQRHPHRLLVDESLVEPAVVAEEEALVGAVHQQRVVVLAPVFQPADHAAHAVVDPCHAVEVVLHVPLVLPASE